MMKNNRKKIIDFLSNLIKGYKRKTNITNNYNIRFYVANASDTDLLCNENIPRKRLIIVPVKK